VWSAVATTSSVANVQEPLRQPVYPRPGRNRLAEIGSRRSSLQISDAVNQTISTGDQHVIGRRSGSHRHARPDLRRKPEIPGAIHPVTIKLNGFAEARVDCAGHRTRTVARWPPRTSRPWVKPSPRLPASRAESQQRTARVCCAGCGLNHRGSLSTSTLAAVRCADRLVHHPSHPRVRVRPPRRHADHGCRGRCPPAVDCSRDRNDPPAPVERPRHRNPSPT
jgi:hypothetical protein